MQLVKAAETEVMTSHCRRNAIISVAEAKCRWRWLLQSRAKIASAWACKTRLPDYPARRCTGPHLHRSAAGLSVSAAQIYLGYAELLLLPLLRHFSDESFNMWYGMLQRWWFPWKLLRQPMLTTRVFVFFCCHIVLQMHGCCARNRYFLLEEEAEVYFSVKQ